VRAVAAIRHVINGHASEITMLKIYAHVMRQKRDDATDRIAVLARTRAIGKQLTIWNARKAT